MTRLRHNLSLTLMLLACSTTGLATELFEPTLQAGPHVIHRLGVGALRRWWIKGCDIAFYAPEDIRKEEILTDIPRCLKLHYVHPIRADQFAAAAWKALRQNLSKTEITALKDKIDTLHALYQDVKKQDNYMLLYVPGEGTTLSLNGQPQGTIKGSAFASAYFGVWLGKNPLDDRLKAQLLADIP
ncbi:MAG: chalcone isomerase family protein [Kiritimatiellae bacterium]|nr:chalcone isomerase family protein [Kiritimatiellia bacterium]